MGLTVQVHLYTNFFLEICDNLKKLANKLYDFLNNIFLSLAYFIVRI